MNKLAIVLVAIALAGCGDQPDAAPVPAETTIVRATEAVAPRGCRRGDTRGCRVVHTADDGTIDCFESKQHCVDGDWAPCGAPHDAGSD